MYFISDNIYVVTILLCYYYCIIRMMKIKIILTRSNPKGIYTSWSITNNVTFTMFSPIKYDTDKNYKL